MTKGRKIIQISALLNNLRVNHKILPGKEALASSPYPFSLFPHYKVQFKENWRARQASTLKIDYLITNKYHFTPHKVLGNHKKSLSYNFQQVFLQKLIRITYCNIFL